MKRETHSVEYSTPPTEQRNEDERIIPLGTDVPPWGTVEAVHTRDGERFYVLIDKNKTVSLVPSGAIEPPLSTPQGDTK